MDHQHLRISDVERERAAADLAEHYAEGRLTTDEHAERLDAIWSARTGADLAPIFDDLPHPARGAVARPAAHADHAANHAAGRSGTERGRDRLRGLSGALRALPRLPVIAVLVLLSAITHLPFWILIFFVVCGSWGHRAHRTWR
ncbi:DUF1707 domain-containing protein [Nocardioides sp. JQ2195]|uniref:DUF1707 SHOCT-like domain-containing protein n=1 Tax=Nocardioides sp. JQ2195 TaxID=2592334 RepID=UPI00143E89E5|nr:DUF1707 domain-containing protein [Nocardioides sp. JQ2195]QIX27775.1 DUF1707 domain-containing protein [Nocardioides sp. JQ2195]